MPEQIYAFVKAIFVLIWGSTRYLRKFTGVSMRKSRLSKVKQDRLMEHFVSGTIARCATDLVGVNFKTSAYYFQRLRELIAYQTEQKANDVCDGEVDESYFGGHSKDNRGRGAGGKFPVFGLLNPRWAVIYKDYS